MRKYIIIIGCLLAAGSIRAQTFINNNNTVQPNPASVNLTQDNFVFGSPLLDYSANQYRSRFFFNKKLSAFRAGLAAQGYWDISNLGQYSFATGINNIASGTGSFAGGWRSKAVGAYSFAYSSGALASGNHSIAIGNSSKATSDHTLALGRSATASGIDAVAIGPLTNSTGLRSIALGAQATANGAYSVALGFSTASADNATASGFSKASGRYSTALGYSKATGMGATSSGFDTKSTGIGSFSTGMDTWAKGDLSSAFGINTNAIGEGSIASGSFTTASGRYATAFGTEIIADNDNQLVLGQYNDNSAFQSIDWPLLVVGSGTSPTTRKNSFAVLKDGDVIIPALPTQSTINTNVKNVVVTPDGRLRVSQNNAGNTVNTDDQTLTFNTTSRVLKIEDGNSVVIPDSDQQVLKYDLATGKLTISNGNTVTLPVGNNGGGSTYNAGTGLNLMGNTFNANVKNGLRTESTDNSIRLGGSLIEKTDVNRDGHDMSFSGAGNFIIGSTQTENQTGSSDDTRMFFAKNGALRSGRASGTEWDISAGNLAQYSTALGDGNTARKRASVAIGETNLAEGNAAVSIGINNKSTARAAVSLGHANVAEAESAVAMGLGNTSSGLRSVSLGHGNLAKGTESAAIGSYNQSLEDFSFTQGNQSMATMKNSVAMGRLSYAEGRNAFSLGHYTRAKSFGEMVVGVNNTEYTPADNDNWRMQDRLFVVGRGNGYLNRQDALIIYKHGDATMAGNLFQSSDKRLKTKIKPITNALQSISKLGSYSYYWNKKANRSKGLKHGFIAQELMEIYPELVTKDGEGYYAVNYVGLVPVLMAAIKEVKEVQDKELAQMKNEIKELKKLIKK